MLKRSTPLITYFSLVLGMAMVTWFYQASSAKQTYIRVALVVMGIMALVALILNCLSFPEKPKKKE